MIKFFRKHNKKLLAIFMVLLMVVFLGGSALDALLQPSYDRILARTRYGEVTTFRHNDAEETGRILQIMGFPWQQPLGFGEPIEPLDWILLVKESEALGSVVSAEQVRSGAFESIEETARVLRKKPGRVVRALTEFFSVRNTALAVSGAAVPSQADVEIRAQNALANVKFNAVVLPGESFVEDTQEFSEEGIAAQFAAYREREPGGGLSFGYYVPSKVKIQYFKVNRDKLIDQVRVVNMEEKAHAFYEQHHETHADFKRPADDAEPAGDAEGPVEEKPPFLSWEEARDIAEGHVRRQEATETAMRIGDWIAKYVREPWLYQTRGEDGYRPAPGEVTELDYYDDVLSRFPKALSYPGAVTTVTTDFFSQEEAGELRDIGLAKYVSMGGGSFLVEDLSDLAFRTQGVVPKVPEERGTVASEYLAMYETCGHTLRDADANVYLFRVVAVERGHIPDSVEEVRDRVVADLRLMAGYEEALLRGRELQRCEDSADLREAYEKDWELADLQLTEAGRGVGFFEVPPVSLTTRYDVMAGGAEPNINVGIPYVQTLPADVIEECFALAHYFPKTKVFELKDRAIVLVVEWAETQPAGAFEFASMRESFTRQLRDQRVRAAATSWLSPDNIRARSEYEMVTN